MRLFSCLCTIVLGCLLVTGCSKESSETGGSSTNPGAGGDYQPTTAGSEWNYHSDLSGNYKLVSLGTDTLVNNVKYYKFDNSIAGRQYMSKENGIYASYAGMLTGGDKVILVTMKDAPVGTTWVNKFNNQGTESEYRFKLVSRGIEKTVNGKTYKDVIGVEYTAVLKDPTTNTWLPYGTGMAFMAKGVGSISGSTKLDLFGFTMEDSTYLVNYTIK